MIYKKQNKIYSEKYPESILLYPRILGTSKEKTNHPTQKPLSLCEYLIKTYSNENETILDNCMGSVTTGVACLNTNRKFIGIESDLDYFNLAKNRIEKTKMQYCL